VGKVRKNSKTTAIFRVDNLQELQIIIDHFNKYPLISAKYSDYVLFEQCYKLIKQKEHLTLQGLEKILALKYNLNKGLPNELKTAFPNILPVVKPEYIFKGISDPNWISGFVSGDSTFSVSIEKSSNKLGFRVRLIFGTCLHSREKDLLVGISNYFNNFKLHLDIVGSNTKFKEENSIDQIISENISNDCLKSQKVSASVHTSLLNNTSLLQIKNISDIENKVIPFFQKYPVMGVKKLDFEDFHKVFLIIKSKEHLKPEGLSRIKNIVNGMNLDRNLA